MTQSSGSRRIFSERELEGAVWLGHIAANHFNALKWV
jgi:hypothetical protein